MSIVDKSMDTGFSDVKTNLFLNWIGTGKKILDLGCYDGRDTVKFMPGNQVYGVEVLQEPAAKAKALGVNVAILDLEKDVWPYEKEFFDIVICGDIIEHVIDVDKFLLNIHAMLKPGGKVIISTPNIASLGRRLMLLFGYNPYIEVSWNNEVNGFPAVGHVRYFTVESLSKLVKHFGFKINEITSDNFNFGPIQSASLAKYFPTLAWRIILLAEKA